MLVRDILTEKVITVAPLAPLREAMQLMRDNNVRSLVVDKQHPHDAYGIITYTTILKTIVAEEGDIDLANVYDVATKPVITVPAEMDVKYVARMMVNMDVRRLVVLEGNQLEGIVTTSDIVGSILGMLDEV
ncbi:MULTISPECIES: CBS domain-containing protein [Thioalkalivibrio]|uniref:Histidine kinase n=1 Tax=Thioalkalivibrio halophilus TaxID=252474 RepID=A0A1V2ZWS7_9GAMM|nr:MULTISPECIES: CBS domain-containing protein [Thioalkalivibrio]OOC09461.1 histidine kinase [Thioalkalivibrio halophilus]PYG00061.1 putative signal-transduction protein containing cAMP-binding and CBS domains [Thioalkalivibrio sp. ALE21]